MEGKWKMGDHFFVLNVWSDFLLDRWRRSGVIRMAAAAARAPTPLRALPFRLDDFSIPSVLVEVPRSQGRGYGGGQIDVGLLPPGP